MDPDQVASRGGKRGWRRLLVRALIVAVVIGALLAGVAAWVARALPRIAAAEIGRLTNTRVETGSFEFHRDGSVAIEGLVIRPVWAEPSYDNAILRARNVYARFDRRSLLMLSPQLTDVRIEDFMFDVQLNLDTGQWNIGDLRVNTSGSGGVVSVMPAIELHEGRLRYCKVSGGDVEVVSSIPVEARFGLGVGAYGGYSFDIQTSKLSSGGGESHLSGYWRPGEFALAGGLSSTDIPSLERAWAIDVLAAQLKYDGNGDYTLDLRMKDVHGKQAPEVDTFRFIAPAGDRESGPLAGLLRFFARYQPTGTVGSITMEARGNLKRLPESEVAGKLVCADVSICDRKFPYAIDHLTGELEFTQSMVVADHLSGRHEQVDVSISGWTKGYGAERQYHYRVASNNMIADETLYAALQPEQRKLWDAFEPRGVMGVDYRLARTSPTEKHISLSVDLQGVTATYRQFPYPLKELTGRLYFDHESIIASDLVSETNGTKIRLNGKVTGRDTSTPVYYVSIDANDVPLDATLAEALPPQHRELYRRLHADGAADVRARVFSTRDANVVGPVSFLADVSCDRSSLNVEGLPFALSDVAVDAAITPDSLSVKRLSGRYGRSRISLSGGVRFATDAKPKHYLLNVSAEEMPLDDKVIDLLPASMAQAVAAFRPQGDVNLTVETKKSDSNEPPEYTVVVECLGNKIDHERFAYPLQDVRGTITATRSSVTLESVTARPAGGSERQQPSSVRIDGSVSLVNDGFESGSFTLKTKDVLFTEELGEALPEGMARVYRELSPRGPFELDLTTLRVTNVAQDENRVEFKGKADLAGCRLNLAGAGSELYGILETAGSYSTKHGFAEGRVQLAADRLAIKGKDVTSLSVDAVYEPNTGKWSAEDFVGDCYSGRLLGSLEVATDAARVPQYRLGLALRRVDLQDFLSAGKTGAAAEKNYSSGILNASLSLGAQVGKTSSRLGTCRIRVADMQVGKVSPLANLLSVLRLSEPTDYAFERLLIDSYVRQDNLLIRAFDLSGKNVAFAGSGTVNLPTEEVDLVLTARGQRVALAEPSILESLTEGLGGAVVRMEVTGKADDPHVETKALPVIEDSLRILGTPE